jgi:lipopolysaccharide/colanic/teichoic acid biosynthesis glycosyltransferase
VSSSELYRASKRALDVAVSSIGLIVLQPVMIPIAVAIRLRMGSPILFRQARVGRDERTFTLCKFRTMRHPRAGEELYGSDRIRITRLGGILRSTSLDELPTLWNVLKGDMSLVGPRPLLPEYLPLYTEEQRRRHSVRPGMTGLAQVSGRQDLTFRQRFALDIEYVEHQSFLLDLRILVKTVATVVLLRGADTGGPLSEYDDIGAREALSMAQASTIDAVEEAP